MYRYSYPSTHSISGLAAGSTWELIKVRLKMTIKWTQRYAPSLWSCEYGAALGGHVHGNLEAVIERVWRYTCRPYSIEFGDASGGHDRVRLEMHLEAMIEWTWGCKPRLWPSEFGDAHAGCDRARLEEYLEVVNMEVVDLGSGQFEGGRWEAW